MKYIKIYEITKKYHNKYKEGDFIIVDMESVMTDMVLMRQDLKLMVYLQK